jgi:pyruvate dehydrogenase complex dehydrogenase (E1) component
MGEAGEGQNTTHSQKKLGLEQVAKFAERFDIPVTKEDVKQRQSWSWIYKTTFILNTPKTA